MMKTLAALTGLFLLTAVVSCKKDNDKKATCRIITVSQVSGGTTTGLNITYNNDGRISTIISPGANGTKKIFTYAGNTVLASSTSISGDFLSSDSITLDNKKRPLSIKQFHEVDKSNWTNYVFEYNGDDLLRITQTHSFSNVPTISTASYKNGNMISLTDANGISTLEYFTDKKVQQGDYLEMVSLTQYGLSIYPHKNLIKSLVSGNSVINFNYEFNEDGTISKVTATSGSSLITISYQYECR